MSQLYLISFKKWTLRNQTKWLALKAWPPGPGLGLTSQVSQRPQQASVVIRRPLQPGFLARKVNSLTAQPTKVCRFPLEGLRAQLQPARRRRTTGPRRRYASFMLFPREGREREFMDASSCPAWNSQQCAVSDLALSISDGKSQGILNVPRLQHRCPKFPLPPVCTPWTHCDP